MEQVQPSDRISLGPGSAKRTYTTNRGGGARSENCLRVFVPFPWEARGWGQRVAGGSSSAGDPAFTIRASFPFSHRRKGSVFLIHLVFFSSCPRGNVSTERQEANRDSEREELGRRPTAGDPLCQGAVLRGQTPGKNRARVSPTPDPCPLQIEPLLPFLADGTPGTGEGAAGGAQGRVRRGRACEGGGEESLAQESGGGERRWTESCAGVPAPGHGGRAGRAAPGDLRRRVGGGRGGAGEQGGGALLRRGPVRAQPRLHAAALRLLRGARGRGAAARALRGGLRVRRRQRAGNAGVHAGAARRLAGAALPRPLPARAEDQVPHHGHPQACDPEAQRGGHHRQRAEADPGAGAGLLPELGGGRRHLPEFLRLSWGPVSGGLHRCAVTPDAAASTRQRRACCLSMLVVSFRAEALICDGKKMLLRECPPSSFVASCFYYS